MRDTVWEYQRVHPKKEALRRAVREILVFVVLLTALMFAYYRSPYESVAANVFMSSIFGIPAALVIWAVYRVVRFALNR